MVERALGGKWGQRGAVLENNKFMLQLSQSALPYHFGSIFSIFSSFILYDRGRK